MKIASYIGLLGLLIACSSCKKDEAIPPSGVGSLPVDQNWVDTTYFLATAPTPDQKVVLVEEFTGVYCYTCPLGHMVVDSLIDEYPEQVAPLNIHSHAFGIYDNPAVMGNAQDFRTIDGDTVVSMLGGIVSVPSGAVDRKVHAGETQIISKNRQYWRDYFVSTLSETPPVNITSESRLINNGSTVEVRVTLTYTTSNTEDHYLSVAVAEDNVVDKQFVDTVVVDNYEHPHILRAYATETKGNFLGSSFIPAQVEVRVFEIDLDPIWITDSLEIVSFVHRKIAGDWTVLQANKQKLSN